MRIISIVVGLVASEFFACQAPIPQKGRFPDQGVYSYDEDATKLDISSGSKSTSGRLHIGGTWATLSKISVCEMTLGRVVEVNNYSVYLVHFVQQKDGSPWRVKEVRTKCIMKQTPILGVRTVYPKGLVESLNPGSVMGIFGGEKKGSIYLEEPYAEIWGARLKDPMNDPLPNSKDDPRVIDSDHDGHIGATMILSQICKVFVTQRSIVRMKCKIKSSTRIECTGKTHVQVNRLDATDPFCLSKDHIMDNSKYSFLMFQRIDGKDGSINLDLNHDGKITCKELGDSWKQMFPNPDVEDDSHCNWAKVK